MIGTFRGVDVFVAAAAVRQLVRLGQQLIGPVADFGLSHRQNRVSDPATVDDTAERDALTMTELIPAEQQVPGLPLGLRTAPGE